jgi:hypothetical protein
VKKIFATFCLCSALLVGMGSLTGCPKTSSAKSSGGTHTVVDIVTVKDTVTVTTTVKDTPTKIIPTATKEAKDTKTDTKKDDK